MNLIDDQDDIAQLLDLFNEALHAAFKLAAELGAGHQGRQIQQVDLLILELIGNVFLHNPLGQTFRNGRLANAGLADEAGIVLLPPVENLDNALRLHLPAHNPVQAAAAGLPGQIQAVGIQELVLFVFRALALLLPAGGRRIGRKAVVLLAAEQLVEEGKCSGLAHVLAVVLFFLFLPHGQIAVRHLQVHQVIEGFLHFAVEPLHILVRQAHPLHNIVNGLQAHLLCAFQAVALAGGLSFLHFGHKNDRQIFLTSGT